MRRAFPWKISAHAGIIKDFNRAACRFKALCAIESGTARRIDMTGVKPETRYRFRACIVKGIGHQGWA